MLALYVNRSFFLQVKQRDNELQIGQNSLSKANILGTAEAVRRLCQCCPRREGAKYRLVPCVLNSFPYRELTKRRIRGLLFSKSRCREPVEKIIRTKTKSGLSSDVIDWPETFPSISDRLRFGHVQRKLFKNCVLLPIRHKCASYFNLMFSHKVFIYIFEQFVSGLSGPPSSCLGSDRKLSCNLVPRVHGQENGNEGAM